MIDYKGFYSCFALCPCVEKANVLCFYKDTIVEGSSGLRTRISSRVFYFFYFCIFKGADSQRRLRPLQIKLVNTAAAAKKKDVRERVYDAYKNEWCIKGVHKVYMKMTMLGTEACNTPVALILYTPQNKNCCCVYWHKGNQSRLVMFITPNMQIKWPKQSSQLTSE